MWSVCTLLMAILIGLMLLTYEKPTSTVKSDIEEVQRVCDVKSAMYVIEG